MKIVLYGATGKSGSSILAELLARGHAVTAVVRDTAKLAARPGLTVVQGDVSSAAGIAAAIAGADAVVSAYAPVLTPEGVRELIPVTQRFVDAVAQAGKTGDAPRFVFVGGAGSLFVAPGVTLIASGHLPEAWLPIAQAHADALELVKASSINWTSFSPAAFFEPGERTGKFRLGKDDLIADAQHNSRISLDDYAIALVDELERPQFERARFTIGY
ncbi:MAG: NAD(P)H-binding protein [Acidobacteriota bacterium]|nr:NAD(P)H-binding protein [Acidobacteriota bacterium]